MAVKRIAQIICLMLLALTAEACGGTPTPTSDGVADLLTESHQVQCRHPGEADKEVPVGQHEPVSTGDEINTDENGLGILTFADFLRVEVFRKTGLQVKAAPDPDAPPIVKLYLALGTTLQELQKRAGERVIVTTETEWATIKSVSTKYLISVDEDEVTSVFVYEGEAEVEAQQQIVTVRAGQATLVEPRQAPRPPMDAEMGAVDDWVSGARQAEGVGSIKPVIFPYRGTIDTFESNGDLVGEWYWLRDSGLQHYAQWTIVDVPEGDNPLEIEITALATDRASGGGGFDASFLLYYGLPEDSGQIENLEMMEVTLENVYPPEDSLGYTCRGTITIPRAALEGGSGLFLRIVRVSASDNHVAFNRESIGNSRLRD